MNDIEKAARLMNLGVIEGIAPIPTPDGQWREFNPRTNKADLSDVIDELVIEIQWLDTFIHVSSWRDDFLYSATADYADHPTKFAARAEAVMSVVSQLYDAKYGKDGE